jgi:hypothetical protein
MPSTSNPRRRAASRNSPPPAPTSRMQHAGFEQRQQQRQSRLAVTRGPQDRFFRRLVAALGPQPELILIIGIDVFVGGHRIEKNQSAAAAHDVDQRVQPPIEAADHDGIVAAAQATGLVTAAESDPSIAPPTNLEVRRQNLAMHLHTNPPLSHGLRPAYRQIARVVIARCDTIEPGGPAARLSQ